MFIKEDPCVNDPTLVKILVIPKDMSSNTNFANFKVSNAISMSWPITSSIHPSNNICAEFTIFYVSGIGRLACSKCLPPMHTL